MPSQENIFFQNKGKIFPRELTIDAVDGGGEQSPALSVFP